MPSAWQQCIAVYTVSMSPVKSSKSTHCNVEKMLQWNANEKGKAMFNIGKEICVLLF